MFGTITLPLAVSIRGTIEPVGVLTWLIVTLLVVADVVPLTVSLVSTLPTVWVPVPEYVNSSGVAWTVGVGVTAGTVTSTVAVAQAVGVATVQIWYVNV